ncbi:MAG: ACT domain-containing protein [Planctomycetes bacterium]|nr:ACT domain-containing protein [Planctomycetota bacterium]
MTSEKQLEVLLSALAPELIAGEVVFCTFENAEYGDLSHLRPIAMIRENEGLTLVIPREKADEHEIPYQSVFKRITLNVHSDLEAVGLTAAFASKLAGHGISANVMAGYFHDHIFVPTKLADHAVAALHELTLQK